jgi:hypothetical protein
MLMLVVPVPRVVEIGESQFEAGLGKVNVRPYLKSKQKAK